MEAFSELHERESGKAPLGGSIQGGEIIPEL